MIIITVQNRFFYLIFLIFLLICQRAMRAEVFSLLFPAQKVCPAQLGLHPLRDREVEVEGVRTGQVEQVVSKTIEACAAAARSAFIYSAWA